jgi:PglZ domain
MALTEKQLALHVARVLEKNSAAVLAYAWPQVWTGGDRLEVQGTPFRLEHCESVLQVRECLTNDTDKAKVLLVTVPESELGQDVLARIYGRQLLHVDRWKMVEEAFGTRQIDPRLYDLPWIADALLEGSITRLESGNVTALTYERAVELCLTRLLGCSDGRFELEDLLSACERSGRAWGELAVERKDVYAQYLRKCFGDVAVALIGALTAGHGHAVISIGLACEVLYGERARANPELRDSQVRLEAYLDGNRLSEVDGRHWAQAAERALPNRSDPERFALLSGATDLLRALGAASYIADSTILPSAFDLRLEALGTAIQQFLRKPDQLTAVEQAAERVGSHRRPPADHPGAHTAPMALALCRREASLSPAESAPSNIVLDYLQNGAWEDYARRTLRAVRPETFARAVTLLLERVAATRQAVERRFAEQLAESLSLSTVPAGTLPIEAALDQLLAPLAEKIPVAVLVLDGMSWDVYYGIAQNLAREGWDGRRFEHGPVSLLATVPSVTEFSRTSLLSGRLTRGTSATEKAAFCAHAGLITASRGKPPVLLHKAELMSGNQLSDEAARVLADPGQPVVGVVLNAVDDALSKSDQLRIDWSIERIAPLGAILAQARLAGRALFITSDHGHVLEMGSQYRPAGDSERWRTADTPAIEGEILIGGSRVRTLMDAEVVVPWSEKIRYAQKKNGYHGGVSRQEMLVPLGLWMPSPDVLPQYPVYQPCAPDWWDGLPARIRNAPLPVSTGQSGKRQAQPDLFSVKTDKSWIAPLLSSPVLAQQRERLGRIALDDERLTRLLDCLDQRGGRASTTQLALAVEQPPLRMRGMVSAMQRMLNIDGYAVLTMEAATGTVILNHELLRKQFEL